MVVAFILPQISVDCGSEGKLCKTQAEKVCRQVPITTIPVFNTQSLRWETTRWMYISISGGGRPYCVVLTVKLNYNRSGIYFSPKKMLHTFQFILKNNNLKKCYVNKWSYKLTTYINFSCYNWKENLTQNYWKIYFPCKRS